MQTVRRTALDDRRGPGSFVTRLLIGACPGPIIRPGSDLTAAAAAAADSYHESARISLQLVTLGGIVHP